MFTSIAGILGALLAVTVLVLMAFSAPLQEFEQPRRTAPQAKPTRPHPRQAGPVSPNPRPTVPTPARVRHTGTTCVVRDTTPHPVR